MPPVTDHCGSCTACLDACPTQAIVEPYKGDGSKCINCFTMELKNGLPAHVSGQFDDWMFGCDVCQDVCPWNRFSKAHKEPLFNPRLEVLFNSKKDWEEIIQEVFLEIFKKSPLKRTKFEGLRRNIIFLKP
ncbi:MAG: epoxyqueuosine reductase [Flavobacteriales bacterium]